MTQLIAHLLGDYCLQNQWMADNKTKRHAVALAHVLLYTSVFVILCTTSWKALAVIGGTHFFIDRYRLAKYWVDLYGIGVGPNVPPFLSVWLLIIVDNTFHLSINALALAYM